ncbi:hypothetical protein AAE478_006281 [Parahypoxylon ruwenzoriense]
MAEANSRGDAPQHEEYIPAFQTIAPSIFVAAEADFTKPPPELPSDLGRARSEMLNDIDEHTKAIQDNIYYMLNREKTRIRRECRQREAHFPSRLKTAPGLTEEEERWLPENGVELDDIFFRSYCPEPQRGPYEVPPVFTHASCLHVETGRRFGESPRKSAEKMMFNLVKHGVQNLEGLTQHVQNVKEARSRELENEFLSKELGSSGVPPGDRMDIS